MDVKVWTVVLALAILCMIGIAQGGQVVSRTVGSDQMLKEELGYRPFIGNDKTEIGGYFGWRDGVTPDDSGEAVEAAMLGIYGTYDLVKMADFSILDFNVPVTWYVGAGCGAIKPKSADWDAASSLFTGLSFGDEKVRLGLRYEYALDTNLWAEFSDFKDTSGLFATIEIRFK